VARIGGMPAEVAMALHLKKLTKIRRGEHLEKMAKGLPERDYQEHVGRAKEAAWLLEMLDKELKNFDIDGDTDEQQTVTRGTRRLTP
jgi:hypothetical protein